MKFIHYQNPLRTRVILTDQEKEIFRLKYKIEYLEDIIYGVRYRLKKDPNDVLNCPNPHMNGKTYWELAKEEIPDGFGSNELHEHIMEYANYYLNDLENGYHCGDCTCLPASCSKCHAEYLLGIDTIKGLGQHEASKINSYFTPHHNFDERTITEVLDCLKHYEPVRSGDWENYPQEYFDSYVPRWKQEAKNAYEWLLNYKNEHGF